MKRIIFCLSFLTFLNFIYANKISEIEAMKTAENFLNKNLHSNLILKPLDNRSLLLENIYIFNAQEEKGFVIISADNHYPEILGYSDRGNINQRDLPCNLKWLLECYDASISDYTREDESLLIRKTIDKKNISPLIQTHWAQDDPYNLLCPTVESWKCVTGCIATAMAQVINYNKWPDNTTSLVPSYITSTYKIEMPELPARLFDWDNMTQTSISELMLYCGNSVKMDYMPFSSGAYSADIPNALTNIFGYSKGVTLLKRNSYDEDGWINLVYNELLNNRPVLYLGNSIEVGGHAFVVDGYQDGMFHLNWGWEGDYDGFYNLNALNPGLQNGFNYDQEIVVNIQCPASIDDVDTPKIKLNSIAAQDGIILREDMTVNFDPFKITLALESDMAEEEDILIGLALFQHDSLVSILDESICHFLPNIEYIFETKLTIPNTIEPGNYSIIAVNRIDEKDNWTIDFGCESNYVKVQIDEANLQLQTFPYIANIDRTQFFGIHTIDGVTYEILSLDGDLRAEVIQFNETEKYEDDIYIPDEVIFHNLSFKITNINRGTFSNCPNLNSVSTPLGVYVENCDNFTNLELRENVFQTYDISNCPKIENITYPDLCKNVVLPINCANLSSITFEYTKNLTLVCNSEDALSVNSLPSLKDIYFKTDFPPVFEGFVPMVNKNVIIHIPEGTKGVYEQGDWEGWNFVEDQPAIPVQIQWDYCGAFNGWGISYSGLAIGNGENDVEFAFRIPHELIEAYKGCEITEIEFYTTPLENNDPLWNSAEYVFVTSPGIDYLDRTPVATIRGAWTNVKLNHPVTISGEDLFVGIGRNHALGASWSDATKEIEDAFWFRTMGRDESYYPPGEWVLSAGQLSFFNHPLPIRAIIEGESLPSDILIQSAELIEASNKRNLSEKQFIFTEKPQIANQQKNSKFFIVELDCALNKISENQEFKIQSIELDGLNSDSSRQIKIDILSRVPYLVNQFQMEIELDNEKLEPITVQKVLLPNHETSVYVDLPENIKGRSHKFSVNISDIDGSPDAIPSNSSHDMDFTLFPEIHFPRKIVMEEATGTWCGYCPLGIEGIKELEELYPENFIPIEVHDDNDMWPGDEYENNFTPMVTAVPSAFVNRSYWTDPIPFEMEYLLESAEAKITAKAHFTDDGHIQVNTETVFGFEDEGNDLFRIAYIVVEDNVGPYFQTNYYSNPDAENEPEDILDWWRHQDSIVETMYNDVARAIYNYNGIEGLFPSEIHLGEVYENSFTIPVPYNIVNGDNIKIITLLLDTNSGEILNADRTAISGTFTAPIEVSSVRINPDYLMIAVGDHFKLEAMVEPENATDKTLIWESKDSEIVEVNNLGEITVIQEGSTFIKAIARNSVYGMCEIVVANENSIDSIFSAEDRIPVYSIKGILLNPNADKEFIKSLPKGLYIIKNKKVLK